MLKCDIFITAAFLLFNPVTRKHQILEQYINYKILALRSNVHYLLQVWQNSKSLWCSGSRMQAHVGQHRAGSWFWTQFSHSRLVWCHCPLVRVPHWMQTLQFCGAKQAFSVTCHSEVIETKCSRNSSVSAMQIWHLSHRMGNKHETCPGPQRVCTFKNQNCFQQKLWGRTGGIWLK